MHRHIRKIVILTFVAVALSAATAAFAEKDAKAGYPWGPFDDRCVSETECL